MIRPAIAFFLLAASTAGAAEKNLDRNFTVAPGGTLVVEADSASVHVSGNDSNQVMIRMRARGDDDDIAAMKFDAVQDGNDVTVTLRRHRKGGGWFNWGSWNSEQRVEVSVPRNFNTRVRTGGGDVEQKDTTGSANLRTSGGNVVAKNLGGTVELRTSGGDIVADSIRGDVDADTSGGDVRLLNIDGRIRGNTSGGSVRCSLAGSNRGISATTSGGDVELILPRTVNGDVQAMTSGGDVTSDLPVTTTIVKDGHLSGPINGGGARIEARTSGGSIRLRAAN
jgi:hypothetical protein